MQHSLNPVARRGTVGENILALLKHVRKIEWELCCSEQAALVREREVIRASVPRYNIADAWEEEYFYIGLKVVSGTDQLHLRFTDLEEVADGFRLYGCFRHRRLVKNAYSALLHALVQAMLENPLIPAYARHSLQADIIALQQFAEACSVVKGQRLSHQEMRENIRISLDEACERAA